MFRNKLYLFILINLLSRMAIAQYRGGLLIGEPIPNVKLDLMKGGMDSPSVAYLSDLTGKMILLDFWDTHCGTCIGALPHMLDLQEKFGDKLAVLIVSEESPSEIARMWNVYNRTQGMKNRIASSWRKLLFVTGDTMLNKIFPHDANPKHVWITPEHKYAFMTYGTSTNVGTIQNFLEGKKTGNIGIVNYQYFDLDDPISWFATGERKNVKTSYSSFFLGRVERGEIEGDHKIIIDSSEDKVVGVNCLNLSILDLYEIAFRGKYFGKSDTLPDDDFFKRISLNIKDKERYYRPGDVSKFFDWADSSTFCYSIKVPLYLSDRVFDLMLADLDNFCRVKSKIGVKNVDHYILKRKWMVNTSNLRKRKDSEDVQESLGQVSEGLMTVLYKGGRYTKIDEDGQHDSDQTFRYPVKMADLTPNLVSSFLKMNGLVLVKKRGYRCPFLTIYK